MIDIDSMTIGEAKELSRMLSVNAPATGKLERKRVVLVIDRGWIFAGDQSLTSDGYVRLDNAVHVFRWEAIGFAKMLTSWREKSVDIRSCESVELPSDAIVFRVPVAEDWGKK